jgi:N6-adenosine-specific RNA methylase IME4
MKRYNVIYADPPWSYDNTSVIFDHDGHQRAVSDRYNLMSLEDLKAMPIKNITEKDCICFMWVVNPLLPEGLELLSAWGFKYKTMLTWKKPNGTGYWFRGCTEHILLGVKGNVKCFRNGAENFYASKIGKHSQKPHYFRELFAKAVSISFEHPKKLELFARSREGFFPDYEYEGWDVYGNEVNNSIQLPQSL